MSFRFFATFLMLTYSLIACADQRVGQADTDDEIIKGKKLGFLGIGAYEGGGGLKIFENTLPPIKSVSIERKFVGGDSEYGCTARAKRPTEEDVKSYFSLAYQVTQRDTLQLLSYTTCYAYGSVTFEDGSVGHWRVAVDGQGSMGFADGRNYHYYCPKCSNLFTLEDLDEKTLKKYGRDPNAGDTFKE